MSSSLYIILFILLGILHAADDEEEKQQEPIAKSNIRRVILDTDGQVSDTFALLWLLEAFKNELISLEAITTIKTKNQSSFYAFRNVAYMVNLTKPTTNNNILRKKFLRIPISKSHSNIDDNKDIEDNELDNIDNYNKMNPFAPRDIFSPFGEIAENYPNIFISTRKLKKSFKKASYSEDLLISKILEYPNEISVICIGALTNLYLAEVKHPGILNLIHDIYIVGGSFMNKTAGRSVVSPLSEYNFYSDSNALYNVFDALMRYDANVFIFPLDTTYLLQFTLQHMGFIYTLLSTEIQTEIEMCRIKLEKEDDKFNDNDDEHSDYDESDLYDSDRQRYTDDFDNDSDGEDNYECASTALLYMYYEKVIEDSIKKSYMNGICDCLPFEDASVIAYLLYPHLFDFKYVYCNIDINNGMIWFDQRLIRVTNNTIRIPNCFVNLNINEPDKILHSFTRDSISMISNSYMDYVEYMITQMEFGDDYV